MLGPLFRDKTREIVKTAQGLSDEEKLRLVSEGSIRVNGLELKAEWFDVQMEKVIGEKGVEILEVGNAVVIVEI